jgi:hypothetical protein
MNEPIVALFGEAEKGDFRKPHFCRSVPQLYENLGEPPDDSRGIFLAVQCLLHDHNLIYFRVKEEGFSFQDYFEGVWLLEKNGATKKLSAICAPGVGNSEVIDTFTSLLDLSKSILIMSEADLYDYLTDAS